jgi:hypothetical protein
MSTDHTPGPWKYDRYGYIESPSTGLPICSMQPAGNLEGKARQRANATLIAAAPDMLVQLRDAAAWLRKHAPYMNPQVRQGYDSICDGIEAAIAKAKS